MNSVRLIGSSISGTVPLCCKLLTRRAKFYNTRWLHVPSCALLMAKKDKGGVRVGGAGGIGAPPTIALPQDSETLAKVCVGANIMKDEPFPELMDDSQYPEWLWSIRTSGPPSLDELDPATVEYWEKLIQLSYKQAELDRPKPKHRLLKDY